MPVRRALATTAWIILALSGIAGPVAAATVPRQPLEADFDGDGRVDLATFTGAHGDRSGLTIHLAEPAAGDAARFVETPAWLVAAAAGDLDADGVADLAYVEQRRASHLVIVRFGLGDATFGFEIPVLELPSPDAEGTTTLEIFDPDRDGDGDLRLRSADGTARLLLHDGAGGFELATVTVRPVEPAGAGAGEGSPLLWNQDGDGQNSYGPSVRNSFVDREVADDFLVHGTVTRLRAQGSQGFPPPPPAAVDFVEVRFYAVAPDGRPGAVQSEYILAGNDPDLDYNPGNPGTFDITLSPPFEATGQHFVGVQPVMESTWYRPSANGFGYTRGSHVWIKNNLAGGTWEVYTDVHGPHFDDITFELFGDLTAPAAITALSATELANSGRLRIEGDNLGGTRNGGAVTIGGLPAWIAEWTDRAIHVYVPEGLSGAADVTVTTIAGASGPAPIQVHARTPEGQVRWRFACDSIYARQRVGIGPSGTIYAQDVGGILYALSPDGALEWLLDLGGQGSEGPVVVGDDGTIYVGANPAGPEAHLHAVHPDGTLRWTFTATDTQGLLAGPGVGPDGRVYAVFEQPGSGAVALDPDDGSLLWLQPGDPPFNEHGQLGLEMAFGADRFFVGFDEWPFSQISLLYGISLDGDQLFAVGRPDSSAQPVVSPDGTLYVRTWFQGAGIRLAAYDQDGSIQWIAFQTPTNVLSDPGVGPDGATYSVRNLNQLWALEPDGSTRWTVTSDGWLGRPIVSPAGDRLILGGVETGQYGYFRAFDLDAGQQLWEQLLPIEPDGAFLFHTAPVMFDAAGTTAYAPVSRNWNPPIDQHCYVYALDVGERTPEAIFADGFESADTSAWSAVLQ